MRRHAMTATLASIVLSLLMVVPTAGVGSASGVAFWLLIEASGVAGVPDATGVLLLTDDQPPPVPVLPGLRLPAAGVISPQEPGCQSPPTGTHYHGALFGLPDPNPSGCGWSRAVMVAFGSLGYDLGFAITLEESARLKLGLAPPDLHAARIDATAAGSAVKRAVREIKHLVKEGRLQEGDGDAAIEALKGALAIDKIARKAIKAEDASGAIGLLGDALAIKREVLRSLESAGVLF
jgi:hypothetical protein